MKLTRTANNAAVPIELNAVIVAVADGEPYLLTGEGQGLPSGPFESGHRTLEQGLRAWARRKGARNLGYVEQLYTFADVGRTSAGCRSVSIGYLALVHDGDEALGTTWSPWYKHLPWEDHRDGKPRIIAQSIMPALAAWKNKASGAAEKRARAERIGIAFPSDVRQWNDELVLQRYELLWEAGLVAEAGRAKNGLGLPMPYDHRRILATAMARLRAKIKYRPVVFELLPPQFTLLQLQTTVEALAGLRLHKQNFRRLVETQRLVEETGAVTRGASGRPAKLFSFRRKVLQERAAAGTKLPRS
ncbi:MAG: hypothetical protein KGI97_04415 [Alphaproteobacteria bacterium]|nr:hypothetical protein [Alphaproteobacteria bacterium]